MAKSVTSGVAYPRDTNALSTELAALSTPGVDGWDVLQQILHTKNVSNGAQKGELLYRFTSASALTGTGVQTVTDSSSVTWDGSGTVKLDVAANGTGGVQITGLSVPVRVKTLTLLAYVPDYTAVKKIQPYVSQGASLTPNYIQYPNYTPSSAGQRNYNGWHLIDVTTDMWTTVATGVTADGTTAKVLRVDLQAETAKAATIYLAAAYVNLKNRPRIFFTFDDGRKSVIRNAFPIAQDYNIPCTAYIIPPVLGTTGTTNFMTQTEVDVLHEAWWCIANHAYNSSQAVTSDSFSEIGLSAYIAQVIQCRDWLEARGYRGARHHAYVEGAYDGTLVDAMAAAGMLTGRTIAGNVGTGAQGEIHSLGDHRAFVLNGGVQLNSTNVLATVEAEIDRAIRDGRDLIITGHDILTAAEGGATATSWTTSDFATLCGYVADLRAKGRCDILPMDCF